MWLTKPSFFQVFRNLVIFSFINVMSDDVPTQFDLIFHLSSSLHCFPFCFSKLELILTQTPFLPPFPPTLWNRAVFSLRSHNSTFAGVSRSRIKTRDNRGFIVKDAELWSSSQRQSHQQNQVCHLNLLKNRMHKPLLGFWKNSSLLFVFLIISQQTKPLTYTLYEL